MRKCFHFGIPDLDKFNTYEQDQNGERVPMPYFEFMSGDILEKDKNGIYSYDNVNYFEDDGSIKVALFGGSTGYFLSEKLFSECLSKYFNRNVRVKNFSCYSAHHRQHLHMILELLPKYNPDIVIFYGGYNDMPHNSYYDPRFAFPYNFYYKRNTSPLRQFLIENSAIVSSLELKYGNITPFMKLRKKYNPQSPEWNKSVTSKYFETLELSKTVTETLKSKIYGHTKFIAFYQPYIVPEFFIDSHNDVRNKIKELDYVFDIHDEYDGFDKNIWMDECHVRHDSGANEHIVDVMAKITANEFPIEEGKEKQQVMRTK